MPVELAGDSRPGEWGWGVWGLDPFDCNAAGWEKLDLLSSPFPHDL